MGIHDRKCYAIGWCVGIMIICEPNLTFENAPIESANRNALDLQASVATACRTVKTSSSGCTEFQRGDGRGATANRDVSLQRQTHSV